VDPATGRTWTAVRGDWTIAADQITVQRDRAIQDALVTSGLPGDLTVQVKVAIVAPGAGIVFRYADLSNHWTLGAAPHYGTWNVTKTVGGVTTKVANTGLASVQNGTDLAVTSQSRGGLVVKINGKPMVLLLDGSLMDRTQVGVGTASTGAPRFRSFKVS
jgi:hypothetical protein